MLKFVYYSLAVKNSNVEALKYTNQIVSNGYQNGLKKSLDFIKLDCNFVCKEGDKEYE